MADESYANLARWAYGLYNGHLSLPVYRFDGVDGALGEGEELQILYSLPAVPLPRHKGS